MDEYRRLIEENVALLLPLPVIFETGNHTAWIADGGTRRKWATIFREQVQQAFEGSAPWTPTPRAELGEITRWLDEFVDEAMRGRSLTDLSVIKTFETQCELNRLRRVFIWSLDQHLQGFDRTA